MGFMQWLEKRAAKQSALNVRINTRTLVTVANRVYVKLEANGLQFGPQDLLELTSAQEQLMTDILYTLANGMDLDELERAHIEPTLSKESHVSEGARIAVRNAVDEVRKARQPQ